MRIIFKLLLLAFIAVESTFAQGTFVFWNYHPTGLDAPVFDAAGNRLSGVHYVAVLYGGSTPDSLTIAQAGPADMPPESFTAVFNGQAGYFSAPGFVTVDDTVGRYAWLQLRVWDTRLGPTYDDVARLGVGGYGQSSLFYTYGGDIEATGLPPQPLRGLESFSLVPEPSSWALLSFGAGILFWKCNRRRNVKQQEHSGN